MLGLWGAALCGLAILVLPPAATAGIAPASGLGAFGAAAHYLIAALGALAGGALAYGIARAVTQRARGRRTVYARDERADDEIGDSMRMRPIDPREDLGSESFDAPLEAMPLGMNAQDWSDNTEVADGQREAAADAPDITEEPNRHSSAIRRRLARALGEAEAAGNPSEYDPVAGRSEPGATVPQDGAAHPGESDPPADGPVAGIDLAQFAALPGRNAVWVEGPPAGEIETPTIETQGSAGEESDPADGGAPPGSAAIARLRGRPTDELSLVEMVERLAAALHERQAAEQAQGVATQALGAARPPDRDAALAEALEALGELADGAPSGAQDARTNGRTRDLAAALAKLHDMRGAA
ncbi:MAG: hypothetical protein RIB52_10030 [Erythrobacter sp.]|uniref:hypothetical protein n=1 Tax=Erythrobacter sp. TaxID=1042 RepID=UPI0032EE7F41